MASQGDESTGKDEGEVKSTPSIYNQYKRYKALYFDILYCFVPFLSIVDEKIFFSKACFNCQWRKVLSLANISCLFMNPI